MTKTLVLIALIVLIYLYWKYQQKPQQISPAKDWKSETLWESDNFPDLGTELQELPQESQNWFTEKHWLSDKEIDWALEQVIDELTEEQANKYKVLEATQFMFAKEAMETKDPEATFSFPVLLSELTGFEGDLVFIPVNNPNFHWSLLVYEAKEKKFVHFDTLRGANDHYIRPLVKELLTQIHQTNEPNLKDYLETRYHLKQGNTWDCGIAVIEIAQAISKDYPTYQRILMYTKLDFDFPASRKNWRQQLENHA